jgi:hypothetical protein
MKNIWIVILLLFALVSDGRLLRYQRYRKPRPSGLYRVSPLTGVRIALPSEYDNQFFIVNILII